MRIVFVGSVVFSLRTLEHLLARGENIVGVCVPQETAGISDYRDLRPVCERHSIPSFAVDNINSADTLAWIRSLRPDVVFCFGWSRLLGPELLALAPRGVVGYHPALLPENRGRHPLIWALALGLSETGSTFFFMDAGADSGDIISQYRVQISDNDDASTLYEKITETALTQLDEFVPLLTLGACPRRPQDASRATSWRKRGMRDGAVDWRMSARSIHNLVRALTVPYVGAHLVHGDAVIKIWRTRIISDAPANREPGFVLGYADGAPVVKAGEHAVCLVETAPTFRPAVGAYL